MGAINRRKFIKNVAMGGAVLGVGSTVFKPPSKVLAGSKGLAGGQPHKEASMQGESMPEIIASCHCKKVVLKLVDLDPRFSVCHCDTCQLIHNGPWYGADCGDIEVIDGREYVSDFPVEHGEGNKKGRLPKGWTAWHFCSNCGSRLYYSLNPKTSRNANDKYNVSVGLLHLICPKDMLMENEVFFDMKPDYYSFHETRKFSADEVLKNRKI